MKESYSNYFLTSDKEKLFYTTNFKPGDKPLKDVLVFNYGLVCSNHHWKEQIKYFADNYNILIYDYRGHYQSTGKENIDKITFEQISYDLYELLTFLKLEDSILLGHSMGVNVCLEFARRFPELCKKLILISGTTMPVYNIMFNSNIVDQVQPFLKKLIKEYPTAVGTFWKLGGWNPIVKKIIHVGGFNIDEVSEEFVEIYLNRVGELGPDIFIRLLDEMNSHDIMAHLESIKTPTLIIGGDKDKVIPNYLQRVLHNALENSELYIVRNGSHVPQVDFPDFINDRVELFIN